MALIDELKIHAESGRGGDGVVRWRQEKFIDRGGPNGGDGGYGGDVYVRAVRDVEILAKYKHKREFIAGDGAPGEGNNKHGKKGADLTIDLPIGSLITNETTGMQIELLKEGEEQMILRGGQGGLGNDHFKSSTNVAPEKATKGKAGDSAQFSIVLSLFADIGLVGLPNAGKSSLLNSVTNAKSKIGSYQFTTLEPHLGDLYGYVIADIPGLIEGASEGRGLGTKFLKHITRTKIIAHLVSFENEDMMKSYTDIRKELEQYGKGLEEKDEVIILTKTDLVDEKAITKAKKEFEKKTKKIVLTLSLYDDASIKNLSDELVKILKK